MVSSEKLLQGSCKFQLTKFKSFLRPKLSKFKTYANKNVAHTIKWKIWMLQPNKIAGFEVTARVLFRALFIASSKHSVCER